MSKRPLRIFISHPSHFLTDCEPHGDGLLAMEYIQRLARRGHELHVAVPLMSVRQTLPANLHFHPVASITRTSAANPPSLNRIEYAIRVRFLLQRLRRHVAFDLLHQLNPVVPGMGLFLADLRLPIVLGPLPPPQPEPWNYSGPSGKVKTPRRTFAHTIRDAVLRRQLLDAALILIPTEHSFVRLPAEDAIRNKVQNLNFGVDTVRFQPDMRSAGPKSPSILFLANLLRRKGVLLLIEAFERIATSHPDCTLRIAGNGHDESEIRERASQSPVASRIEFVGRVAREDVPALCNGCTVYCLPSYYEPFGMTALEAMACGKPVVGSNSGGLGLLLDDDGGRRTSPGNVNELAKALDEVLASPSLQASMGHHNRRKAVELFEWDRVIDRLEELYGTLLNGGIAAQTRLTS